MKNLIIITGCPGTGKSFWAKLVCQRFPQIAVLSYDALKEAFWDQYGFRNNEEKTALNEASLQEFYQRLDRRMAMGEDILIEYPFNKRHAPNLQRLIDAHGYRALTLYLYGDMRTIYSRGQKRDGDGGRHPGHLLSCYHKGETPSPQAADAQTKLTLEQFIDSCQRKNYDIRLGYNLPVDVTDFHAIDYEMVLNQIAEYCRFKTPEDAR